MIPPLVEQLAERRRALGLTQAQLAAKAATSQSGVSHIETGVSSPTLRTAVLLAEAMDADLVLVPRDHQ